MKSKRSLSEIAAQVLANESRRGAEVSASSRAAAIDGIARAMRQRKRRRRLRLAGLGAVAVAASIALAMGWSRGHHPVTAPLAAVQTVQPGAGPAAAASFVRGRPVFVRGGAQAPLADGVPLEVGDRVVVEPGSRTTVALANGSYVLVEDDAELVLASIAPATRFDLASGSMRADVAKLKPHERFVIHTADAEIEVRGTSFDVSQVASDPACGHGTTTRVRVREGIVAVRSAGTETLVHKNEVWPSGCAVGAAASVSGSPPSVGGGPLRGEATARRSPEPPASDLSAQNDLFEKAIARKRAGDAAGAIGGFETLLARYPNSHLAQSARAERMKLLRGIDRERARSAATDYLKRYPDGFARRDAELIVSGD